MRVERLSLTGFRSYPSLDVAFPAGPQVVVGRNAAGKTNLLEALVVLALGHSHRTSTDLEMIRWDAPFARLEARVGSGGPGTDELELVLARPGTAASRKRIRVNGVPRRASALSVALRAVVFAPEDMLLVVGSPSLRRALLDTLVAQQVPQGSATLSTYARALQQRNTLLRRIREGEMLDTPPLPRRPPARRVLQGDLRLLPAPPLLRQRSRFVEQTRPAAVSG